LSPHYGSPCSLASRSASCSSRDNTAPRNPFLTPRVAGITDIAQTPPPAPEPSGRTRTDSPSPYRGRRRGARALRPARGPRLPPRLPPGGRRRAGPGVHAGHVRARLRAARLVSGGGGALHVAARDRDVGRPERAPQGEAIAA